MIWQKVGIIFFRLLKIFYLFLERGEERERKTHVLLLLSHPPTGDLAGNPGMCSDWESKWQLLGLQAGTQSTEPHQPGQYNFNAFTLDSYYAVVIF